MQNKKKIQLTKTNRIKKSYVGKRKPVKTDVKRIIALEIGYRQEIA